jgi:hypothetical protein
MDQTTVAFFVLATNTNIFYFFRKEMSQVMYPSPLNRAWKEMVMGYAANVLVIPSTRARPGTDNSTLVLPMPVGGGSERTDANEGEGESPSKHHRAADNASTGFIGSTSYWLCSPEAHHCLFRLSRILDSLVSGEGSHQQRSITETPQEALERCIKVQQSVHKREDSWSNVIIGRDIDNF